MKGKTAKILLFVFILGVVFVSIKLLLIDSSEKDEYDLFGEKLESLTTNLLVENVDSSIQFYEKYVGFKLYKKFPFEGEINFAVLEYERKYIMLQDKEIFKEDKPVYVGGEIPASFSLYIEVDNADSIYKRLIVEEVEVVQDYQPMFYGRKEFSIKDLDGHIITFSESDKEQFDEIDSLNFEFDKYFNRSR
jgi:uncharacterized glyoxalase superfamily protein PhnB